jgi:LysM repeat protein
LISLAVIALAAIAGVLLVVGGLGGGRPGAAPTSTVAVQMEISPTEGMPGVAQPTAASATAAPPATEAPAPQPTLEPTAAPTQAPTDTPAPTVAPSATPAPPEAKKYTVKAGDSCYKISREFDISIDDLIRINKLRSNCFILPGQELIVSPTP